MVNNEYPYKLEERLNSKDKKYLERMKKMDKYYYLLQLIFAFSAFIGFFSAGAALHFSLDNSYIVGGLFFIYIGVMGNTDIKNNRKAYEIIRKIFGNAD